MSRAVEAVRCQWTTPDEATTHWDLVLRGNHRISFYQTMEWYTAVQKHLLNDLLYVTAHLDGEPIGIFPMSDPGTLQTPANDFGLPVHPETFLCDCLVADSHLGLPWGTILLHFLHGDGAVRPTTVSYQRIPAGSCAERAFAVGDRHVRRARSQGRAHCDVSAASSLTSLSAKHLRNVDRLARKATREFGSLRHISFEGPDAAHDGLDVFVDVEASGWKGPGGTATSLSCKPTSLRFYRDVLQAFGRSEGSRVDVLKIDGRAAAAQVAVRCRDVWNVLKVGFDETFSSCGPGNILLKSFIEQMIDDSGSSEVSLVTAPSWAERWHMQVDPTFHITLFATTLRGRVRLARHDAMRLARGLRQKATRITSR